MLQLSDLLIEKKKIYKTYAEVGRRLGGVSGQVIGGYASGENKPSLDFAIKWKQAFNENLIDLLFQEEKPLVATEPEIKYESIKDKYIHVLEQLTECQRERDQVKEELDTLKKFGLTTATTQLKAKK